ncbi:MAG: Rrf2 family transcriptional regulator [Bacillota bacterium]|nr:Rrf2 family transcriptional regulator [Bacillota bacterium]
MNISTKGRYGLRAVLDLAVTATDRPVSLSSIAARQHLSEGYLEQLMASMKKAGIVKSSRGSQGGYSLARDPHDIRVGEVFRALEGPLALTSCISEEHTDNCSRVDACGSAFIWKEVQDAISFVLDKYSIGDLLDKEISACGEGS